MKKRLFSLLLVAALFLGIAPFSPFPLTADAKDYLTYEVANNKATITACDTTIRGDFKIPEFLGGYPVTAIGRTAFLECRNLTSVSIPNSVTSIGDGAFALCSTLISIHLPDSITSIGYGSFYECRSLQEITLPFLGSNLNSTENAYLGYIFAQDDKYDSVNYVPFSLRRVVITKATSIASCAFYGCRELNFISLPDHVVSIGDEAFASCIKLSSLRLPDSIITIGRAAFSGCKNLKSINIPANLTAIKEYTFNDCPALTSVTLPKKVTLIEKYAFHGCDKLADVWYKGTQENKKSIAIHNYNEPLKKATWHCMFADLKASHWSYSSVFYCYQNGLLAGVSATKFAPNYTMTRAMVVAVLYRHAGSPAVSGSHGFSDVKAGQYYTNAVIWASQNKIVSGISEHTFAPNNPITRAQFVALLHRYAEFCKRDGSARAALSGFADSKSVPNWATQDIQWAVAEGLLSGSLSGSKLYINPNHTATRAQAAVLLKNFCEK